MSDPDRGASRDAPEDPGNDFSTAIAALRLAGAARFDPARFRYLEVLASRLVDQQENVKSILGSKLAQALADFGQRFARAQSAAQDTIARSTVRFPQSADALQQLFVAGDFSGVNRYAAALENHPQPTPLGDLARYIEQHSAQSVEGNLDGPGGPRTELKTMRYFRNTWSKLSVDKQVTQAIDQGPENAGPLNSHMLLLRALERMRDISPDYLNRFMSYVDTLLCLDQAETKARPPVKKPLRVKTAKRSS